MQETIDEIYAEECTASWFLRPKPPCIPDNLVILRKNSRFCGCIEFGLVVNNDSYYILHFKYVSIVFQI